jgi:L-asparaginase
MPGFDGPSNLRDAVRVASAPALRGAGVVVSLAGSIEPADDAQKSHATALDTFRSPNGGSLGRVVDDEVVLVRARGARRQVRTDRAAGSVYLLTATVATDGVLLDAAIAAGADRTVVAATGSDTDPSCSPGRRAGDSGRHPGRARVALSRRPGDRLRVPGWGRDLAPRGPCRWGTCAIKRAWRWPSGWAPASIVTG